MVGLRGSPGPCHKRQVSKLSKVVLELWSGGVQASGQGREGSGPSDLEVLPGQAL